MCMSMPTESVGMRMFMRCISRVHMVMRMLSVIHDARLERLVGTTAATESMQQ